MVILPSKKIDWTMRDVENHYELEWGDKKDMVVMGPPFSQVDLHLGTVFTSVLKDILSRTRHISSRRVTFIHG